MTDYMKEAFEAWFKSQIWGNEDFKACLSEAWQAALLAHTTCGALSDHDDMWASGYMKEAERLLDELRTCTLAEATHYASPDFKRAKVSEEAANRARSALLAHIQREAVPDMYDRIAEAHDAPLDEDHTGCRAILKECMRLLAAAPDHFRDATKMMAYPANPDPLHLSRILHELAGAASLCWEPRPTGVFDSQLAIQFVEQALAEIRSRMTSAPAEAPMPKPVAYGFGNTAITGHTNRLMMVRIDIPGGDQYAGAFWLPLVLADEAHTYGVACRAAGEAAGYARGLAEAGRDAERYRTVRFLATAERDPLPEYAGDTSSPDAFDASIDHATAALRGEVKP